MHLFTIFLGFSVSLITPGQAVNIPRDLEARDAPSDLSKILSILKASPFCSSVVGITDVTRTSTSLGAPGSTQVTVSAACTPAAAVKHKRQNADLTMATATRTEEALIAIAARAASTPACNIKGLPTAAAAFACSVVTQACRAFVKPKTITVSGMISIP